MENRAQFMQKNLALVSIVAFVIILYCLQIQMAEIAPIHPVVFASCVYTLKNIADHEKNSIMLHWKHQFVDSLDILSRQWLLISHYQCNDFRSTLTFPFDVIVSFLSLLFPLLSSKAQTSG